jgi:hypothetical protein
MNAERCCPSIYRSWEIQLPKEDTPLGVERIDSPAPNRTNNSTNGDQSER